MTRSEGKKEGKENDVRLHGTEQTTTPYICPCPYGQNTIANYNQTKAKVYYRNGIYHATNLVWWRAKCR